MPQRVYFLGLFFPLLSLLSCATPPKGPAPLPGEELLLCFGAACPSRALLEKAQTRIGTAEIARRLVLKRPGSRVWSAALR